MAIWQTSIKLASSLHTISWLDTNDYKFIKEFVLLFPEEESWCQSIKQFGDLEQTCLEIDPDEGTAMLRLDLRTITKEQFETIILFCDYNGFKVKYKNKLEEPTVSNFIKIIKESQAFRYINNPEEYFNKLILDEEEMCK